MKIGAGLTITYNIVILIYGANLFKHWFKSCQS